MTVVQFPNSPNHNDALPRPSIFPDGPIGDLAEFIYRAAPYPNPTIALAAAIGFFAGVCGRAYNIKGVGLNLYILVLAGTGLGKDAMADGISLFMSALQRKVDRIGEFKGPGEIRSDAALLRTLANLCPSFFACLE